jgi:hypothetical protein
MKKAIVTAIVTAAALFASTQVDAALARPPVIERDVLNRGVLDVSDDGRFALTADPLYARPDALLNLATNARTPLKFLALHAHLTSDGSAMVYENNGGIYRYVFATKKATHIVLPPLPAWLKTCWGLDALLDVSGDGKVVALRFVNPCLAGQAAFLYDTVSHTWRLPDKLFPGYTPGMGRQSNQMKLSANGRLAVWVTFTNAGCTRCLQVWAYNWTTNTKTLVSARYNGAALADGNAYMPDISPDGSTVSFRSDASNVVKGITTVKPRVYVRKLATKVTTMITDHESTYDTIWGPALAANGAVITLLEDRPTLSAGKVYLLPQPVMYYVANKANVMLDQPAGTAKPNNFSRRVMASGAAHKIVFTSWATNFVTVLSPKVATDRTFVSTFF